MAGAADYHHVRENVPLPAVMRWFDYAIAEDEIKLLATQKMWADEAGQVQIMAEIEQRFNKLCDPIDEKQMESMIERAIAQQTSTLIPGNVPVDSPNPLAPSRRAAPKTILDTPIQIPPELLNR